MDGRRTATAAVAATALGAAALVAPVVAPAASAAPTAPHLAIATPTATAGKPLDVLVRTVHDRVALYHWRGDSFVRLATVTVPRRPVTLRVPAELVRRESTRPAHLFKVVAADHTIFFSVGAHPTAQRTGALATPAGVRVDAGARTPVVSWSPVANAYGYLVQVRTAAGRHVPVGWTRSTSLALPAPRTRDATTSVPALQVIAVNADGSSAPAVLAATPAPGPSPSPTASPTPTADPTPTASPTPTPTATSTAPAPPPVPATLSVTWPSGGLVAGQAYTATALVQPAVPTSVTLQVWQGDGWTPAASSVAVDGGGQAVITFTNPAVGRSTYRVVAASGQVSATQRLAFAGSVSVQDFYTSPTAGELSGLAPGTLLRAQQITVPYLQKPTTNPVTGQPLVIPQIGTTVKAGPPACMTNANDPDCTVPGAQFRFLYTVKRWRPTGFTGDGTEDPGVEAASGVVFVPPNAQPGAPVVAWAHPTLGQADQCSISRGTDAIVDPTTGQADLPGGMAMNMTDMAFWLNQLLAKGYVVVAPDYLGIAVHNSDGSAKQKTYLVGQQEARDLYYAVKTLQSSGWGAVLPTPGTSFVTVGHSQGGHASMWAGVEKKTLDPETGLTLLGVVAAAPATDLNMVVSQQWNSLMGWVIGPEVWQTWAGYLPKEAQANMLLTPTGQAQQDTMAGYCVTQVEKAAAAFADANPPQWFLQDPTGADKPAYQAWGQGVFFPQTPVVSGAASHLFPKDLPFLLLQGPGDNVILAQTNAALQESFCPLMGTAMKAFWPTVMSGDVNPKATVPGLMQASDHFSILAFPFASNLGTYLSPEHLIAPGALIWFAQDRFAGKDTLTALACGQRATERSVETPIATVVSSWYSFVHLNFIGDDARFYESDGNVALAAPVAGNTMPATTPAGCGLPYAFTLHGFVANDRCTPWGLYPWGSFLYTGAGAGAGWGTYPYNGLYTDTE